MTRRLLCGLLCATALGAAAPAADAAPRKVPRGFQGVMYDGLSLKAPLDAQRRQFRLMARSGVESVRATFIWEFLQRTPRSKFDFEYTDRLVGLAAAHGIELLPVMLYAPPWARVFPKRLYSPPRTEPYVAYLRAAVSRYGSDGSFWREHPKLPRRPLRTWQVWNEPNIDDFWDVAKSHPRYGWPQGYATLLKASYRALKDADAQATVVTGGLVGLSWLELRRLYKAGAGESFDVAALHIYPQTELRVLAAVRKMRETLDALGGSRQRIYLTETAFPASRGRAAPIEGQRQETPAGMAKRLRTTYGLLARDRLALGLDRAFWYTWASGYTHRKSNFEYAGLLASPNGVDFRPQPALSAFRSVARRYQGCVKTVRGTCR